MDENFLKIYEKKTNEYNEHIEKFNEILTLTVNSFKRCIYKGNFSNYNEKYEIIKIYALIFDNINKAKNKIKTNYFKNFRMLWAYLSDEEFAKINELFPLKKEKNLEDFSKEIRAQKMINNMQKSFDDMLKDMQKDFDESDLKGNFKKKYPTYDETDFEFESDEERLFVESLDWFSGKEERVVKKQIAQKQM